MLALGPHTESMEAATAIINQGCHACSGTGTDSVFGGACSECAHQEATDAIMRARYAGVNTGSGDKAYTPGERMDGRSFGGGSSSNAPSEKQIAFIAKLASERNVAVPTVSSKQAASAKIEELLAQKVELTTQSHGSRNIPAGARANKYADKCCKCGNQVEAEAGLLSKTNAGWSVEHAAGECGATEQQEAPASAEE